MYTEHFGFREDPFGVSPDPRFLYLGPGHQEAFAALMYGVKMRRGFMCLIGEPGTGKTTLLYALLEQLENSVRTVFLPGTDLTFKQRLQFILESLGSKPQGGTVLSLTRQLQDLLADHWRSGNNVVLIFDEAQNLSVREMEDIRLLTNFEVPQAKLLQVMLVGQPQLKSKLTLSELAQLKQRITVNVNLRPLTMPETSEYVEHRLRCTEWNKPLHSLLSRPVLAAIYEASHGIPRLINAVCHNALLVAYAENKYRVEIPMVKEAAQELDLFESVPLIDPIAASMAKDPEMQQWLVAMSAEEANEALDAGRRTDEDVEQTSDFRLQTSDFPEPEPVVATSDVVIAQPNAVEPATMVSATNESWPEPELLSLSSVVAEQVVVAPPPPVQIQPPVISVQAPVEPVCRPKPETVISLSDLMALTPAIQPADSPFIAAPAPTPTGPDDLKEIASISSPAESVMEAANEMEKEIASAEAVTEIEPDQSVEAPDGASNVAPFKPKVSSRFRPAFGRVPGVPGPLLGETERRPAFVGLSAPALAVRPEPGPEPMPAQIAVSTISNDEMTAITIDHELETGLPSGRPSSLPSRQWQQVQPVGLSMDELLDELETFIYVRESQPAFQHDGHPRAVGVRGAQLGMFFNDFNSFVAGLPDDAESEVVPERSVHTDHPPFGIKGDVITLSPSQMKDGSWTRPEPVSVPFSRIEVPAHWSKPQLFAAALFLALFALCVGLVGGFVVTKFYGEQMTAWMTDETSKPSAKMTGRSASLPDKTDVVTSPAVVPATPSSPAPASPMLKTVEAKPVEIKPHTVIVQRGDTLPSILRREYGYINPRLVKMVQTANPQVEDWDILQSGEKLLLPLDPEAETVPGRQGP